MALLCATSIFHRDIQETARGLRAGVLVSSTPWASWAPALAQIWAHGDCSVNTGWRGREKDGERKGGEGNTQREMQEQGEGWGRAGTQDKEHGLHRTLTCIHAVVHLVVTGLSIFTQVAWGWGFWELKGRWCVTWPLWFGS